MIDTTTENRNQQEEQTDDTAAKTKDQGGDSSLKATTHYATARFKNDWGVDLLEVTLRHRRSNDASKQDEHTWYGVKQGTTTSADLDITFESGFGADWDYWWVMITPLTGSSLSSKNSFSCNLTYSDRDGVVTASVDGQNKSFKIDPSVSGSCSTKSMKPISSTSDAPQG